MAKENIGNVVLRECNVRTTHFCQEHYQDEKRKRFFDFIDYELAYFKKGFVNFTKSKNVNKYQ